jgi:hypothetical protein
MAAYEFADNEDQTPPESKSERIKFRLSDSSQSVSRILVAQREEYHLRYGWTGIRCLIALSSSLGSHLARSSLLGKAAPAALGGIRQLVLCMRAILSD